MDFRTDIYTSLNYLIIKPIHRPLNEDLKMSPKIFLLAISLFRVKILWMVLLQDVGGCLGMLMIIISTLSLIIGNLIFKLKVHCLY